MKNIITLGLLLLAGSNIANGLRQPAFLGLADSVMINNQDQSIYQKSIEEVEKHSHQCSSEQHKDSQDVDIAIHFNVVDWDNDSSSSSDSESITIIIEESSSSSSSDCLEIHRC